jgi:hypothetical protein
MDANCVRLIPFTAVLYSSIVGVLPKIVDKTTTGLKTVKTLLFLQHLPQLSLEKDA